MKAESSMVASCPDFDQRNYGMPDGVVDQQRDLDQPLPYSFVWGKVGTLRKASEKRYILTTLRDTSWRDEHLGQQDLTS